MKYLISLALLTFSWLAMTTQSLAAVGDVNYISDVVNVPLRSGPSTAHRIIHRGLPSGTQLTVLATDEEASFTQVRTSGGMEGWVASQYLMGNPSPVSGWPLPRDAFKASKPKSTKNAKRMLTSSLRIKKPRPPTGH